MIASLVKTKSIYDKNLKISLCVSLKKTKCKNLELILIEQNLFLLLVLN